MKVFTGTITETYARKVAILAESELEANQTLERLYQNEDIDDLGPDDWDHWDTEIDKEIEVDNLDDDISIYDEDGLEYDKEDIIELKECNAL